MKIYYAHHLWKYGTEIERFEIGLIQSDKPGCTILNPNGGIEQTGDEQRIMEDCLDAVGGCDALVFSDLTGVVGRGVAQEIYHAQAAGIPVGRIVGNDVRWYSAPVKFRLLHTGSNRVYAEIEGGTHDLRSIPSNQG